MQPEAGLKVPLGLPIVFEEASHACVGNFPLLDTVFPDLLDGWFRHCLAGTYAERQHCCPDYQKSSSDAACLGGSVKSDTFN